MGTGLVAVHQPGTTAVLCVGREQLFHSKPVLRRACAQSLQLWGQPGGMAPVLPPRA